MGKNVNISSKVTGSKLSANEFNNLVNYSNIPKHNLGNFNPSAIDLTKQGSFNDYTQTGSETWTIIDKKDFNVVKFKYTANGDTINFDSNFEKEIGLFGIDDGGYLPAGTYLILMVSMDDEVYVSVPGGVPAPAYSFADSYSMLIDADTEGGYVADDSLWPGTGGTDRAFSWELWYKTPASLAVNKNIIVGNNNLNNDVLMFITSATAALNFAVKTDSSNKLQWSTNTSLALSINTLYHIVGTYDASKTIGGLNVYIDNVLRNGQDQSAGTYSGMPAVNSYQLQIPYTGATVFGEGQFRNFRQFNIALSVAQINTLYNSGTPLSLSGQATLLSACELELQFEQNLLAKIGTNGTVVGSPTYIAS